MRSPAQRFQGLQIGIHDRSALRSTLTTRLTIGMAVTLHAAAQLQDRGDLILRSACGSDMQPVGANARRISISNANWLR